MSELAGCEPSRAMSEITSQRTAREIPRDLIFNFDPNSIDSAEDPHLAWKAIRDAAPPVFWNEITGHWVVTRAEDIKIVQLDHERFSHACLGRGLEHGLKPVSLDPPEHSPIRAMIMPAFMPKAINVLEARARALAGALIDGLKPKGECEFISEFASIVPMEVFLGMVALPSSDRPVLISWVRDVLHGRDPDMAATSLTALRDYLTAALEQRREGPGADLLSLIVTHEIEGQKFSDGDCLSIATVLMLGGLDTVASMLGFVARALATHPEIRQRVRTDPKVMPVAIEEMLRRFGLSTTPRMITQDFDFGGAPFRRGDLVQQAGALYGLDDTLCDRPFEIDLDREPPILHAAFGSGVHTCPGQVLARREMKVFMEEWLARIPEFEIKPATQPQMKFEGLISMTRLELVWAA